MDEDRRPVGVVTDHDLTGVDRFTQLSEVMSKDLVLLDADIDPRDAFNKLDGANRKLAPAVDKDGRLVGILTRKAALRATLYTTDEAGPPLNGCGGQAPPRSSWTRPYRRRRGRGRGRPHQRPPYG
ncbi:hypothetical protein SMICM17S_08425 [Streptomyces microflavus]